MGFVRGSGTFGVCSAIEAGVACVRSMSIFETLAEEAALSAAREFGLWLLSTAAVIDG
jgi:hypothetical protein